MPRLTFWLCCFSLFASSQIQANPDPLHIGVYHYPPFVICNGGSVDGLDIHVLQAALRPLKSEAHFHCMPLRRLLNSLASGKLDGALPLPKQRDYQAWGDYLDTPLHYESQGLATTVEKAFNNRRGASLAGKVLALEAGTQVSSAFERQRRRGLFELREIKDTQLGLKSLMRGRVDGHIGNATVIGYTAMGLGLGDKITVLKHRLSEAEGAFLLLSKKSNKAQLKRARLAASLKSLRQSGRLKTISSQYLFNKLGIDPRYCPQQLELDTIDW